jgi:hypothetical protein
MNALKLFLSSKPKIKHVLCSSTEFKNLKPTQLTQILGVLGPHMPKVPIVKTLDFSGNSKLTSAMAKHLAKLIKWK